MIYYENTKIMLRDMEFGDVLNMGPNIMDDEIEEMKGFFDLMVCSPTDVLYYSFKSSYWNLCMERKSDGAVVAACGLGDWGEGGYSSGWLLSTAGAAEFKLELVRRGGKIFIDKLKDDGGHARCLVGTWMTRPLEFLKWLGFRCAGGPYESLGRDYLLMEWNGVK